MGKNKTVEQLQALEEFVDRGLIQEVLGVIKSGKEATVYLCEAPDAPSGLLAAKVYRSRDVRGFANDAMYRQGRTRGMRRREALAIELKSRGGRQLSFSTWVSEEYETLRVLHAAGADVPAAVARSESCVLMEYICDEDDEPAPPLSAVRLELDEAQHIFEQVLRNIEMALANDRVHGDLSAFNLLYDGRRRRAVMIDFPQTVDARFNSNALTLLERDVDRVCAYFERYGIVADGGRIARGLWGKFLRSEL